ncbi:glutaminyl-peptide cyclotransferase [Biscogniauxia mediterranea]|nr:glutaminyl-peptide cyclotransferase [Biscogniauxia mediterranea]
MGYYVTASLPWAICIRSAVFFLALWIPALLAYEPLSDDALRNIPSGADDLDAKTGALLAPILIPRVPGTPGSEAVQRHFVEFFSRQLPRWTIDWQNSTSKTPATGDVEIPFSNIIFTRDPPWAQPGDVGRLTLVAHYDSLHRPEGFIGAVDSAVPCAMMMHVARSIDEALTRKWDAMEASGDAGMGLEGEKGIQFVFMDGEEAWHKWTDQDSLYGARAMAESWEDEVYPAASTYRTRIESIDLFLLLDLLGGPNPNVPSYFPETHWAYQGMAKVEERMRKLGVLSTKPQNGLFLSEGSKEQVQSRYQNAGYVLDDHVPFLTRGVNVLHIIPSPFPPVWHTMRDDGDHLDRDTVDDWARIIAGFAAEWMELDGFIAEGSSPSAHEEEERLEIRSRSEL